MSLAVGVGIVLLQLAIGWWPATRLGASLVGDRIGRMGLALILGGAITGVVQVAVLACDRPATIAVPAALAVGSLLGLLLTRSRPAVGRAAPPLPRLLLALLGVVLVLSTSAAVGLPFTSDGTKFWAPRARELMQTGALSAPSLHDDSRLAFHRDYPLLVPALLAPAFAHSPPDAMTGPKLVLHSALIGMLLLVCSRLGAAGRRGWWLAAALLVVPAWTKVEVRESAVAAGYVDATLAGLLVVLVLCVEALRSPGVTRRAAPLLLGCLSAGALASTKLEGGVAALIVLVAWGLSRPRDLGRVALLLTGAAVISAPTWYLRTVVLPGESALVMEFLTDPTQLLARSLPVLAGVGGRLLDTSAFGLLPLLLLALGGTALARDGVRRHAFIVWLVLGVAGFLLVAYLGTSMTVDRHIYTSCHRLVLQWLPALALLVLAMDRSAVAEAGVAEKGGAAVEDPS